MLRYVLTSPLDLFEPNQILPGPWLLTYVGVGIFFALQVGRGVGHKGSKYNYWDIMPFINSKIFWLQCYSAIDEAQDTFVSIGAPKHLRIKIVFLNNSSWKRWIGPSLSTSRSGPHSPPSSTTSSHPPPPSTPSYQSTPSMFYDWVSCKRQVDR